MPPAPRDLPVWTLLTAALRAGQPVALLCVVQSSGSSPGRQGFKMAVTSNESAGSIGGGIMEHKWVELARQRLATADAAPLLRPQIHRREAPADRSGMMCSGEQEVLLLPLGAVDLGAVAGIETALRTLAGGFLEIDASGMYWLPDTTDDANGTAEAAGAFAYQPGPAWHYQERLGFRDRVTIVGGGHVALALSRVLAMLDFEITVLDDRPDLPTLSANEFAHYRRTLSDYEAVATEIPEGPNRYVVVMTVGYRTDAVALRQLLGRNYRYLGVMGSVAKVAELRQVLRAEEFDDAKLRGPIGVPINSRTPEEIAVSVAAELIAARNGAYSGT